MFSLQEKQKIAAAIEKLLLDLKHPEMSLDRPKFLLRVWGKEDWSWANIQPNWTFNDLNPPETTAWNEGSRKFLDY